MIFKRLFNAAYDRNKTLQEKMFSVIPVIGLLSMFLLIFIMMLSSATVCWWFPVADTACWPPTRVSSLPWSFLTEE